MSKWATIKVTKTYLGIIHEFNLKHLKLQLVGLRREWTENLNECNFQVFPLLLRCGPARLQSPSLQRGPV